MRSDDFVAFARRLLETDPVENFDLAARVPDQASHLQPVGAQRYGISLHPQHVRQKLLRQGNNVRLGYVLRLQEPAAQPSFHGMNGMAGGGLLRLNQYDVLIFMSVRNGMLAWYKSKNRDPSTRHAEPAI